MNFVKVLLIACGYCLATGNPIDDDDEVPGYQTPEGIDINLLENQLENNHESAELSFKEELLENPSLIPSSSSQAVTVHEMSIVVKGRDDISFDLTGDNDRSGPHSRRVVMKEGVDYQIKIGFQVHSLVSGLKYQHFMKRRGIDADKQSFLMGSYGPHENMLTWLTPPEEAPKGLMARGFYRVHSRISDVDNKVVLAWDWGIDIKSDWE